MFWIVYFLNKIYVYNFEMNVWEEIVIKFYEKIGFFVV